MYRRLVKIHNHWIYRRGDIYLADLGPGRGSKQGYCILNSDRTDNQRLQALCRTTDGFAIAEEDLKIRGSGDVTGTIQSGFNEYVELALRHQKTFKEIQDYFKKNHNKSKGGI